MPHAVDLDPAALPRLGQVDLDTGIATIHVRAQGFLMLATVLGVGRQIGEDNLGEREERTRKGANLPGLL